MLNGFALKRMLMSQAGDWSATHDGVHNLLVDEETYALLVLVLFATEIELVSFILSYTNMY